MPKHQSLVSLLLLCGLLLTTACQKKWKKTAPVEIKAVLTLENSSPDLDLTSGNLRIDKFEFDGKRQQGKDVYFSDETTSLTSIDISSSSFLNTLRYDIPQGTYDEIRCRIRFKSPESTTPSIHVEGTYVNASSQSFPVVFESFDQVSVDLDLDNSEVIFIEETNATGTIHLNLNEWFASVTENQLDNADTTLINSIPTILIDEQNNSDLYEIIFNRIGTTESISFN